MQQIDKIKQYSRSVCEQIRWKKAHAVISEEIENHLLDQKNAFLEDGLDEITATNKAIEEMGDPVMVGSQLDRTHRPKIEWSMVIMTILSLAIGLAIMFFIRGEDSVSYFYYSLLITVIGILFMIVAYIIDFSIIGKYPMIIYFFYVGILFFTLYFSPRLNGRPYYLSFFILIFPTVFAGIIYNMRNQGYLGLLLCGFFYAIPSFIILLHQNTIFILMPYSFICLILLTIAIYRDWFQTKRIYSLLSVYTPVLLTSVFLFRYILNSGYYRDRIQALLNPELFSMEAGFLSFQIRSILSNSVFFGSGSFKGEFLQDLGMRVPNSDFLLTYLIHSYGWVTLIVILLVLVAFLMRGFYLCGKQKSLLGRLISVSILLTITLQAAGYIVANLGFPISSQTYLPLILPYKFYLPYLYLCHIVNLALIGIMLSVFKSGDLVRDKYMKLNREKNKHFRFIDGKIIIDLNLK